MSGQGIVKRGTLKQNLYLGAAMFADISRGYGGLVSELGVPIYDSGDIFEIVAAREFCGSRLCFVVPSATGRPLASY